MMLQYLLIITCCFIAAEGINDTEVQKLFKDIAELKKDDTNLQQKFGLAINQISGLRKDISHQSGYCKLLPTDPCGPCTCLDYPETRKGFYCDCQQLTPQRDCLDFYNSGYRFDGVYKISMNNWHQVIQVWCDQTTDGGGWTVFQRRVDATTDFYRGWSEYKKGFGDIRHNFWLGNEKLHFLTYQGYRNQLRVDMIRYPESYSYAKYGTFNVGFEWDAYRLHVSGYSGSAGNYLSYHNGMKFTTFDRDNDNSGSYNCASNGVGAWWFDYCSHSSLNGVYSSYQKTEKGSGLYWGSTGIKWVEMKVKRTG